MVKTVFKSKALFCVPLSAPPILKLHSVHILIYINDDWVGKWVYIEYAGECAPGHRMLLAGRRVHSYFHILL